jgi:UDP-glucose 4-epimerase
MTTQRHIIFGGKGFIGQNLARELAGQGEKILIVDKDHWQQKIVYHELLDRRHVQVVDANIISDFDKISNAIENFVNPSDVLTVWHLAANSDISAGNENINVDLNDTFITTVNILKLCQNIGANSIYFASSSAVYGDFPHGRKGFRETDATQPISNYGAMKLASEAVLRSAHQQFLNRCLIFRFPNVIGFPATHGVIRDFIQKLIETPKKLRVLGDGNQNKPYLHVQDLVSAMLHLVKHYDGDKVMETINIGSPHKNVFVHQIAKEVRSRVSPDAQIIFGDSPFGWVGDMPSVQFNIDKILSTEWSCKMSGIEAVQMTINQIMDAQKK